MPFLNEILAKFNQHPYHTDETYRNKEMKKKGKEKKLMKDSRMKKRKGMERS